MNLPYHFSPQAPISLLERRKLLNLRGQYAQISGLVLFVCVSGYARYYYSRKEKVKKGIGSGGITTWLNSPPARGWGETRKQYLVMLTWLGWMLLLSAWKTGDDYLHLTKSLAHTIFANIPFQILLSPKLSSSSSYNPILSLTGIPQPATVLTPYHRLFGRIVIFPLLILHAVLYLTFFTLNNVSPGVPRLLWRRVWDQDVQLGITGIVLVFVLWVTSSSSALHGLGLRRRVSRKTFYYVHVSLVGALLAVAYYHVVYAKRFVLQALAIYAVDIGSYLVEKARRR